MTDNAQVVLAKTLFGEARGCGAAGMRHVASVVLNRVAHPTWWGSDIVSVCLKPYQFSCYNQGDVNRAKLEAVTEADAWFAIAMRIAADAIAGKLVDDTQGADSYYALSLRYPPLWAHRAVHTFSDGWHTFWRTQLGPDDNPCVSIHAVGNGENLVVQQKSEPTADDLMAAEESGASFPLKQEPTS